MITEHNGFKLGDRVIWRGCAGTIVDLDDGWLDASVAFDLDTDSSLGQWVRSCDLVKL